ncbi:hypothetical protein [Brevibacterium samyangense]|uniref:SipW-cognate class signal peptide n=1 Tax=Brevibacterium samyangense TaxID=366888 RepID=A0ABP5EVM3_9MICO
MGQHSAEVPRARRRPRPWFLRLRALLAGGLVHGSGAGLTLASWPDSEYSQGNFQASVFAVEGNTGSGWAQHDSAGSAATMSFTNRSQMSPNSNAYGYIDLRTTSGSTIGGTVTLSSIANTNATMAAQMEYRLVVTTTTTTCSSASYPSTWTAMTASASISAPLDMAARTTQRVCANVRIKPDAPSSLQGATNTTTWTFTGTSSS